MTATEEEKARAHTLVIELLAHQFAYPVQWIDTQDTLLREKDVRKIIEIGPSNILTGLAKQSIDTKYRERDVALSIKRQLLNSKNHSNEIYHIDETPTEDPVASVQPIKAVEVVPTELKAVEPQVVLHDIAKASSSAGIIKIADAPVKAEDILVTILAQKLKKSPRDISLDTTIKSLVAGRSTLENEIVGDLIKEFGNVPEKPEVIPVKELALALSEATATTKLGKHTSAILQRIVSTQLPGDYSQSKIRKYLQDTWTLEQGRQESIFLSIINEPPTHRLENPRDVNIYLDKLVKEYAQINGLPLEVQVAGLQQKVVIEADTEAIKSIMQNQENLARQNFQAYADFLKVDIQSFANTQASMKAITELQTQLDAWLAEHGEIYAAGIMPVFDTKKARSYFSYWNWALQELDTLFHEYSTGGLALDLSMLRERIFRITNGSSPILVTRISHILRTCHQDDAAKFFEFVLDNAKSALATAPLYRNFQASTSPRTFIDQMGTIKYSEPLRDEMDSPTGFEKIKRRLDGKTWVSDLEITELYRKGRAKVDNSGLSFQNQTVLLTGAGRNSIGMEILEGLLMGGAKVIVTTNSFSPEMAQEYQKIYANSGGKSSMLVVVPFNQGSQQDVESLVEYIYDEKNGLGWDLDSVIPFAAIGTEGREIDKIDSKSELAHRIMLINVIRLIGAIKTVKESKGMRGNPTHVILPLSPNHGTFGGDGLYAESKIALESLFNKWHSETWSEYISICGASIGWVRGTGLMKQNDIVAEGIERLGAKTYSRREMAGSILSLLNRPFVEKCEVEPLFADLNGGLDAIPNLQDALSQVRHDIKNESALKAVLAEEQVAEDVFVKGNQPAKATFRTLNRRANIKIGFPRLPNYAADVQPLKASLEGMMDLQRAVVIVGFAELGPCGNSRTRWEMEVGDDLSLEACIEMSWIMGLITFNPGTKQEPPGWHDAKTKDKVEESDIKRRYESHIREHSGIRFIEPTFSDDYNPHKKRIMQEIIIQQDLAPFETSKDNALNFQREHGEKAQISPIPDSENYMVVLKKNASVSVPKAVRFSNDVAGQIPQGWNPRTYGISEEVINQVDPSTLFVLVTTIETLYSAGITDPYEIYQYIHLSELGNCIGTGLGGISSLQKMYRNRFHEHQVQSDILQETFLNSTGAWVNMLLLSSAGPLKSPVGACATAIESLDTAYDMIACGKAKMCFVGGADDFGEETSFEFANMKATSNADTERSIGRSPKEMSRPAASSRKGFVESQGSGIQLVCSAKLALDMGLPVYGVVVYANMSSDKAGRSFPAPGKGVITNAREAPSKYPPRLLDARYRRRQIDIRRKQIAEFRETEMELLESTILDRKYQDPSFDVEEYREHMIRHIDMEARAQEEDMLNSFGNNFWRNNPEISPIKGALASWGLSIDDIHVASFHGTSTVANEINECAIIQAQMEHLGRSKGNNILGVFQKNSTGHPKGAAGAWMLNGCLQMMDTGLVPGNRNLDNLDDKFQEFDLIAFRNKTIRTRSINAFTLTSFGFGQKGGQVIGIHPKYLFASVSASQYNAYVAKLRQRQRNATSAFNEAMISNNMFVEKEKPPYEVEQEISAFLDPNQRF